MAITSRELIKACGQDPDEPLGRIEFPSEMRQAPPIDLLREQHAAMADVMALRRISANAEQRSMAEKAIAVWRKVETFLKGE